jgi:hypothetical protein
MAMRPRIYYNAEQKAEMWDRWKKGESLKAIGRVFDRPSSSVFNQLSPSGGIRPPPRQRSRITLTLSEREEISRGIVCDLSVRTMAALLGRSPSTVIFLKALIYRYTLRQDSMPSLDSSMSVLEKR